MKICNNFKEHILESGGYSFYNPFKEDKIKKKEDAKPVMVSDITTGSLYKQKQAYSTPSTEFLKTPNGYSVFATKDFRKGDIIEIAPAILQGEDSYGLSTLKDILFQIDRESGIYALVLGNGSLYASSETPNVEYGWNKKLQSMYFMAKRSIQKGEELTIDYGADYWSERIPDNLKTENILPQENTDSVGEILSRILYNKSIRG